MRRTLAVACALVVMLGGCAGGDDPAKPTRTLEPQRTASSPSPKATASDSIACGLLTAKERRSIAGQKIDFVAPVPAGMNVEQCRWITSASSPSPAIQVVTSTAQAWIRGFPQQVDSTIVSGRLDERFSKRLLAAKEKVLQGSERIGNAEACDMFSLLIRANGGKKGTREIVLFGQAASGEPNANVQKCTKGRYTLLSYEEPGLTPSAALSAAVLRLGEAAHQRAITRP